MSKDVQMEIEDKLEKCVKHKQERESETQSHLKHFHTLSKHVLFYTYYV